MLSYDACFDVIIAVDGIVHIAFEERFFMQFIRVLLVLTSSTRRHFAIYVDTVCYIFDSLLLRPLNMCPVVSFGSRSCHAPQYDPCATVVEGPHLGDRRNSMI